jgi:glycosyltransferase involved in cell wall biosynthesis
MLKLAVRRASRCIAVSHTTRRDLLDLVGHRYAGRVDVAYEGPVLEAADGAQARLERLGVRDGYLLYVGDRRPHKNLPRLLELYDALRLMHGFAGDLVLAGSTRDFGYDLTSRLAGREDVRVLGNVTDADLAALYQRCRALAFLSAYEGFGLPVVEAARFGVPMLLSDGGALAEIAPPGACIVPCAMPVAEAGVAVARYLADPGPRALRLGGEFTWQAAARAVFPQAYR